MAGGIEGITVKIGGDTTELGSALAKVNSKTASLKKELKGVNTLLKMDPGNTTLLAQKQQILTRAISETENKLNTLKDTQAQVQEQFEKGEITEEQYRDFQREIVATKQKLDGLNEELKEFGSVGAQKVAQVGEKMQEVGGKVEQFGKGLSVVSAGTGAILAGSMAAFVELDAGYDTIITKTGATGDALEDLNSVADNIFGSMPTDMETVGVAVGEINTRFGYTGEKLEGLSKQFIQFAEINGVDLNTSIGTVDKVLEQFNMDASEAGNVLDIITKKAQETGIGADTLMNSIQQNGATFKDMGIDVKEAVVLMSQFEANGVNVETALKGLKKATVEYAKDGKSMEEGLAETIDTIKNAKTETEALAEVEKLFGAKGANEMVKAIREGRMSVDDLSSAMNDYSDTVSDTFEATLDPIDQGKVAMNNLKLAGAELGASLQSALAPMLTSLVEKLQNLAEKFSNLSPGMKKTIVVILSVVTALGPLTIGIGKLITAVGSIMTFAPKLVTMFGAIKTALSGLWTTLMANPMALVTVAVVGLVAVLATLIIKSKESADAADELSESEKKLVAEMKKTAEQAEENAEAFSDMQEETAKATGEIDSQFDYVQKLWKELDSLADSSGKVEEKDRSRAKFILGELNGALGTEYGLTGDIISNYDEMAKSIDEVIEKKRAMSYLSAYEDDYKTAVESINTAEQDRANKLSMVVEQQKKVDEAEKNYLETREKYPSARDWQDELNVLLQEKELLKEKTDAYNQSEQDVADYYATINGYEAASVAFSEGKTDEAINLLNEIGLAQQSTADTVGMSVAEEQSYWEQKLVNAEANLATLKALYDQNYSSMTDSERTAMEAQIANAETHANSMREKYAEVGGASIGGLVDGMNGKGYVLSDTLRQKVNDAVTAGKTALGITGTTSTTTKNYIGSPVITGIEDGIKQGGPRLQKTVENTANNTGSTLTTSLNIWQPRVKQSGSDLVGSSAKGVSGATPGAQGTATQSGNKVGSGFTSGLDGKKSDSQKSGAGVVNSSKSGISSATSGAQATAKSSGSRIGSSHAQGINSKKGENQTAGSGLGTSAKTGMQTGGSGAHTIGQNIGQGLANGIASMASAVIDAGASIASQTLAKIKAVFDINSPSKETMALGEGVGEGLVLGIENMTKPVVKTVEKQAKKVLDAFENEFTDNRTEVQKVVDESNAVILESEKFYADESLRIAREKEEKAYQEKLSAAKTSEERQKVEAERQKELEEKANQEYLDGLKKTAEEERKLYDARIKDQENLKNKIIDTYKKIGEECFDSIEEFEAMQKDFADKLIDFGYLMSHNTINWSEGSYEFYSLADLDEQNAQLEKYADLLLAVKERGNVPQEFFSVLRDMDVTQGTQFAETLLKASDAEFNNFIADWSRQQALADSISKTLYADEAEALAEEITSKFDAVEEQFTAVGSDSATQFEEGFLSKLGSVVANIREQLTLSLDGLLNQTFASSAYAQMSATVERVPSDNYLAGASGGVFSPTFSETFNRNTKTDAESILEPLKQITRRLEQMGNSQIVLDTGVLVGETIQKIDDALADRQYLSERGV